MASNSNKGNKTPAPVVEATNTNTTASLDGQNGENAVELNPGAPGDQNDSGYVAPQVQDLSGDKPAEELTVSQEAPSAPQSAVKEATFNKPVGIIAAGKMTNAKGTATTDIIVGRIEKHMKHLAGELGFANKEERQREQISFIETVGNSLQLEYPQFVLVTDALLNAVKANQSIFDDGLAFRFMGGLDKNYPAIYLRTYQSYMGLLAVIAKNWTSRNKLGQQVDLGFVTKDFNQKAKENINQYFRQVINA